VSKYYIYTDGAARGNPGPSGAGVLITDEEGNEVVRLHKFLGKRTNNVAEYAALYLGLSEAKKRRFKEIVVFADSELMVRQIRGEYRVKNEGLKKVYKHVMEMLLNFKYRFYHVRREKNKIADQLANLAIDEALEG